MGKKRQRRRRGTDHGDVKDLRRRLRKALRRLEAAEARRDRAQARVGAMAILVDEIRATLASLDAPADAEAEAEAAQGEGGQGESAVVDLAAAAAAPRARRPRPSQAPGELPEHPGEGEPPVAAAEAADGGGPVGA
jgi:hypothetical protein